MLPTTKPKLCRWPTASPLCVAVELFKWAHRAGSIHTPNRLLSPSLSAGPISCLEDWKRLVIFFSVRTDAGVVRAEKGAKGGMRGHPVFCSVRPESIRLQPFGGSLPELMNQLTAEVQSIMYRGDSEEYSLRLSDGAILRAVEHDQAIRKPQVGEQVTVQFDPRDVVVLPQEESSE